MHRWATYCKTAKDKAEKQLTFICIYMYVYTFIYIHRYARTDKKLCKQVPYLAVLIPHPKFQKYLVESCTFLHPQNVFFCFSRINPAGPLALFSINKHLLPLAPLSLLLLLLLVRPDGVA